MNILSEVLSKTSIHGVKFIVNRNTHWTERLFWLICLASCWYGCGLLTIASWEQFRQNPISFVVETTYKDWDTPFPAVAVCETENNDKIEEASDTLWSKNHDFNLEEMLKEIAFYKGLNYYLLQTCGTDRSNPNCPNGNFSYYANLVRSSCDDIMDNCTWMKQPFDCCKEFKFIQTELGPCYIINSVQIQKKKGEDNLKLISNRRTGPGYLILNINVAANIYILGEEEVPSLTTLNTDILPVVGQVYYRRKLAVRSIENDEAARSVSWEQRRCRYPDEGLPIRLPHLKPVYPKHSYSACTVQCRRDAQIEACNCSSFFMPNTKPSEQCDFDGLACLHEQFSRLTVVKAEWSKRSGLYCKCPPSCTETDIAVVSDERVADIDERGVATVEIGLAFLPTERFRRNVVRTPLDLVVSVGSAAGLFLGASILSFVEVFYLVFSKLIGESIRIIAIKLGNLRK